MIIREKPERTPVTSADVDILVRYWMRVESGGLGKITNLSDFCIKPVCEQDVINIDANTKLRIILIFICCFYIILLK